MVRLVQSARWWVFLFYTNLVLVCVNVVAELLLPLEISLLPLAFWHLFLAAFSAWCADKAAKFADSKKSDLKKKK